MGNNTSRTVIRGEFKPSKPLSRKSLIMNIQNYSFGDASPYVIENIDNITRQTIDFLSALQTNVVIPLNSGMIDETPQTNNILEYLLNLRLIKVNEVEGKKYYSFVSTTYQDQPNIGQTYNTLLTEYIDLLKTLGTYYSDLTLTKLETDNANQRDIVAMKTKINDKIVKMTNYIKFFHFESYILDYSRFVYMIYAIQMFKDIYSIYDVLKTKSDLTTLDYNIDFKPLQQMDESLNAELLKLSNLVNNTGNTQIKMNKIEQNADSSTTENPLLKLPQNTKRPQRPLDVNDVNLTMNPELVQGQSGFVQQQQQSLDSLSQRTQQGGNQVQKTITRLKSVFEEREKDFMENREAFVVFLNTINGMIESAAQDVREIYNKKYENILTDDAIVAAINTLSNKISQNKSKLTYPTDDALQEELDDLAVKISSSSGDKNKNKKVSRKELLTILNINKKLRELNKNIDSSLNPLSTFNSQITQ